MPELIFLHCALFPSVNTGFVQNFPHEIPWLFFDFSLNFLSNQITFPLTNFWHWIKFSKANCIVNTELHCQYGIYEEARLLSVLLKKNYQSKEHIKSPQLVTKYLRLTLVFTRNSTIQENYNFSEVFS